ncbi:hypothetical protein VOLCADRAFT_89488 [Volvox carteri f. nagariensis]|uniref:DIRP domain-containing protein n=1 Tax=Volvox carteri f. nagariensis TaxID=3068 RepID=D8TRZ1_VOLCA|nr:uncharacterized protein VOLCADRAFT_89488 [Volvox carteri f. nagariensis]EFJ49734.1 hypothetical protein VOLCADRAFT_89488 [Volvox carteri f. nagariensis]|eukprot:XP_002949241.1 hypothetical protein VOLCADRAFT_89488 [Volvox carteri f. nagariensis]
MAGANPPLKLEDDILRKFYRSFHKHGAPNWAKMSKDTKLSIEQCEMLHKQHTSFLSLSASPDLETAFLAMVNDHYHATQNLVRDEMQDEDMARSSRPRRGEVVEAEAQVATSSSQVVAKAPPSPPNGDWTSSQRKRSRRLFEDTGEQDAPRYRSPILDRWRGRPITDVDEGVDALLSLACGASAHTTSALDDHPTGAEIASNTADPDYDAPEPEPPEHMQETPPKRQRGARGSRTTPTPSGTPVKGGARSSSAAGATTTADALPMANATGLRSPRPRGGAPVAAVAPASTNTSGRTGAASGGRPKKEPRGSPTSSQQRGTVTASPPVPADASGEANATAPPPSETTTGAGSDATPDGAAATAAAAAAAVAAATTSPGPAGRPVRKRKPTAIALAAAAAAEEEEGTGGRGVRSVVAAVAAAVAAAEATQAVAAGSVPAQASAAASPPTEDGGSTHITDMASNTAALLASVPPVRTRGSARLANSGPGSRRAGERPSPAAVGAATEKEVALSSVEAGAAPGLGPLVEALAPAPTSGRARVHTGGSGQSHAAGSQSAGPISIRLPPARAANQPLPGRTRRRKSLPERLPPMWESLKVPSTQTGAGTGGVASAAPAGPVSAVTDVAGVGATNSTASGETSRAMPAAEAALRHCLGPRVRRWCTYEFLYSALDRPWFLRNELLLPTSKLTRLEWSVLRASLGRPRRLSLAFLREERLRLEGYRQAPRRPYCRPYFHTSTALHRPPTEHARLKYEEVALGMEVPHELPRQLRVGQEVTARHPHSRQLYDGVILTVKGNKYRVQFHRGDLMTEVILDTDVMPVDPHECLSLQMAIVPFVLNGRAYDPVRLATLRGLLPPQGVALRPPTLPARPLGSSATGLDTLMMREQDAAMVAEVQRALEVKEELVAQLTQLNNEAASGLHTDENGGRTDNFQLKYTNVVLKLRDTNTVLEAALSRLQARQQQISVAAPAAAATFGPSLMLQQQQQLAAVAASAAAAAAAAGGVRSADSATAGMTSLPQQQPQGLPPQPPVVPTQPQAQGPPQSTPQTPPRQATNSSALPAAAPSPTVPQVAPAPVAPVVPQASGAPVRPTTAKPMQGTLPLGPGVSASTPEQLVEQALVEARTVVDGCRGKGVGGQPLLIPSAPQPVSVVAPIILQAPGGASVPLVLPPGAVLPQQLVLQAPVAAAGEGLMQEQVAMAAAMQSSHALPGDGDVSSDGREVSALADSSATRLRDTSAEPAEPSGTSTCVKTEDESSFGRPGLEVSGITERTAEAAPSACPAPMEESMTEEQLAESWLRDVIVGCVGVLFTIQKCTAGNVSATTVAEALDLAVQQLRIRTDGENDALYADIVQSVQGLKGHLTRAFA